MGKVSATGGGSMTAPEARVLSCIPIGRDHALTNAGLARSAAMGPRAVQRIVQSLRLQRIVICSTSHQPAGFYLPADREESEIGIARLRHRLSEQSATVMALEAGHAARYGPRQLRLEEAVA